MHHMDLLIIKYPALLLGLSRYNAVNHFFFTQPRCCHVTLQSINTSNDQNQLLEYIIKQLPQHI